MPYQPPLPAEYQHLAEAEVMDRIARRKAELGRRIVILGHHYQADDIVRFADFTGDSFKLSRQAASEARGAEFIIFCGVHFMAESADILAGPNQQVILPDLSAGCSMADMADIDDVAEAWETLTGIDNGPPGQSGQPAPPIVPICYVNSSASVKAFVGQHGGTACTSSNAARALAWALGKSPSPRGEGWGEGRSDEVSSVECRVSNPEKGRGLDPRHSSLDTSPRVLFIPDQHLGRNTAFAMGYPLDSMAVWDPAQRRGGLTDEQLRHARFILWKGHCSVHQVFTPADVDRVRADQPGIQVIVHPECPWEVVQKADQSGSTERIIQVVEAAPPGSQWAVGTEVHLVKRLADRFRGVKHVQSLSNCQCLCATMYRIDPVHLLWVLDNLSAGRVVNRIVVDDETKRFARVALDQMLALPGA